MNKQVRIKSLSDYISRVTALKPREHEDSLYHEEIVFRGLSDYTYQLVPALGRSPSEHWINSLTAVEGDLVSRALQKFPDIFQNDDLPVAKLAKLQHFGIPTRMMDVTSNALVALYFACKKADRDGEVVAFSYYSLPAINPYANMIADTYRLLWGAYTDVGTYYYRAVKQDYSILIQRPGWESADKKKITSFAEKFKKPLLVESFEISTRQKNQQGKFILFPNKIGKLGGNGPLYVFDDLVRMEKTDKTILKRYIIPKELKPDLRKRLSVLGISEEYLFADNIDTVFESVKQRQLKRFQ